MYSGSIIASLEAMQSRFEIEIAASQAAREEALRLRCIVYCHERGFEVPKGGMEWDDFDERSHHVLLRSRDTGIAIGTTRLVTPKSHSGWTRFPMQQATALPLLQMLPETTAEISRFAISKFLRAECSCPTLLLRLFLMRGIVRVSNLIGLTYWCALMEPSLLRLLQTNSVYFQPVGSIVEHHGLRQPTVARITTVLERIADEQPYLWAFLTDYGQSPCTAGETSLAPAFGASPLSAERARAISVPVA